MLNSLDELDEALVQEQELRMGGTEGGRWWTAQEQTFHKEPELREEERQADPRVRLDGTKGISIMLLTCRFKCWCGCSFSCCSGLSSPLTI